MVGFGALLYVLGGVALFVVMPALALAGTWRRLEPGPRRALLIVSVIVLVLFAFVGWGVHRWASSGPLD